MAGVGLSSTPKALRYAGLSVSLGLLAQYPTVWHSRLAAWVARIPFVFFRYLLIVVAFTSFIFSGGWRGGQLPLLLLFAKYSCGSFDRTRCTSTPGPLRSVPFYSPAFGVASLFYCVARRANPHPPHLPSGVLPDAGSTRCSVGRSLELWLEGTLAAEHRSTTGSAGRLKTQLRSTARR